MSSSVSPLTPRTEEYYAPTVPDFFSGVRSSVRRSTVGDSSSRTTDEEKGITEVARAPSRSSEAPEWVPPEVRHNGESGWVHVIPGAGASEKVPVDSSPPEIPLQQPKNRVFSMKIVMLIAIAVLVVFLGIFLGFQFGYHPEGGTIQNPAVQGAQSTSIWSSAPAPATVFPFTIFPSASELLATSNIIPTPTTITSSGSVITLVPPPTTVSKPSFSLGSFNNQQMTLALAASPGGKATSTITIAAVASSNQPNEGTVQTVPVFHSKVFSPASYESTLTYTAAQSGATQGIGVVDCPQANNAEYIATGGILFQKLCYADIADSPNIGAVTVASLNQCIEACVQDIASNTDLGGAGMHCQAVSYGANITLALKDQKANCWFKSSTGFPSAGDWQQSTATFLGYIVD